MQKLSNFDRIVNICFPKLSICVSKSTLFTRVSWGKIWLECFALCKRIDISQLWFVCCLTCLNCIVMRKQHYSDVYKQHFFQLKAGILPQIADQGSLLLSLMVISVTQGPINSHEIISLGKPYLVLQKVLIRKCANCNIIYTDLVCPQDQSGSLTHLLSSQAGTLSTQDLLKKDFIIFQYNAMKLAVVMGRRGVSGIGEKFE